MKTLTAFFFLFFMAQPVFADQIPVFIQNTTPRVELAQELADGFTKVVLEEGEFLLTEDKFDKSFQVLIQATNSFKDLYGVSVIFLVNSGTCIWYFDNSIFTTSPEQIPYETKTLYAEMIRRLPEMKALLD
ncbi:MAG: hypothetical protein ACOC0U_05415 [Desulfovibrionales bacterium]